MDLDFFLYTHNTYLSYLSIMQPYFAALTVGIVLLHRYKHTEVTPPDFKNKFTGQLYLPYLLLGFLLSFAILDRLISYAEPFETDITAYMLIAERILEGADLYTDVWDHKPPGIYLIYAFFSLITGSNTTTIWLVGYTAYVLTFIGCYKAACYYGGKPAGIIAAVFWTLFNTDLLLQGNQPNSEVFINASLIWGLLIFLQLKPADNFKKPIIAGILFFLATFIKTVVIVVPISLSLIYLFYPRSEKGLFFFKLKQLLMMASVSGLLWLTVFFYFYFTDSFKDFYEAVFEYNQFYAGSLFNNLVTSITPSRIHGFFLPYSPPLLFVFLILVSSRTREFRFLAAFLFGCWLSMALPGRFFPHYYQLLIPGLMIGLSWVWILSNSQKKLYLRLLLFASISIPLTGKLIQYSIPYEYLSVAKYRITGYKFIEGKAISNWLDKNLDSHQTLYYWGSDTGVYFWSRRTPPTSVLFNFHQIGENPVAKTLAIKNYQEVIQLNPDMIIVNKEDFQTYSELALVKWIKNNYTTLPASKNFTINQIMVRAPSPDL